MANEYIQPQGLARPAAYTQVVMAQAGRTLFISGQVAVDENGWLVGRDDLRAQAQQVYENLRLALVAGGATFADVVKLTTYIVNYSPEQRAILNEVRSRYVNGEHPPASTLIGVQALAQPEFLIEVEAIAVVA